MNRLFKYRPEISNGFSLIEVVLAMGIFLITALALVGLLGPSLKSVSVVEKTDEVASVVDFVNAFLQSSTEINTNGPRFDAIYNAVQSGDHATLLAFRARQGNTTVFRIGFVEETDARVTGDDIYLTEMLAISAIYRIVLTPSSTVPIDYHHSDDGTVPLRDDSTKTYRLSPTYSDVDDYNENFFSMEARIYIEDPKEDFLNPPVPVTLASLNDKTPIFTYDTAILRY